jgi:hypothetical protein
MRMIDPEVVAGASRPTAKRKFLSKEALETILRKKEER